MIPFSVEAVQFEESAHVPYNNKTFCVGLKQD